MAYAATILRSFQAVDNRPLDSADPDSIMFVEPPRNGAKPLCRTVDALCRSFASSSARRFLRRLGFDFLQTLADLVINILQDSVKLMESMRRKSEAKSFRKELDKVRKMQ